MNTLDALSEVSHEMKLMAHYLRAVSCDNRAGAEAARLFSSKILELQSQIELCQAAMAVGALQPEDIPEALYGLSGASG